jgi:hypothetical protein
MRQNSDLVLRHIDQIQFVNGLQNRGPEIRQVWKRRFQIAKEYNWPFALGIAKVDKPSPIWSQGSGKNGVTHPGYKYQPKKGEEHKEVLRLLLLEVPLIVENGLDCGGNANVVQLDYASFKVEVTENYIVCDSIEVVGKTKNPDGSVELADGESIALKVLEQETGPRAGNRQENWIWRLNSKQIGKTGDKQVEVSSSDLSKGSSTVTVESKTKDGSAKACYIKLVKFIPPPPPKPVKPTPTPVKTEECPTCNPQASRTTGIKDDSQDIVLTAGVLPEGAELKNGRWTMRFPGEQVPRLLGTDQSLTLHVSDMPHDVKGKLIAGEWVAVYTAEYTTAEGKLCKLSCPLTLKTTGKGWNKAWLALLALIALVGLKFMTGKNTTPCSTCGTNAPPTPALH